MILLISKLKYSKCRIPDDNFLMNQLKEILLCQISIDENSCKKAEQVSWLPPQAEAC